MSHVSSNSNINNPDLLKEPSEPTRFYRNYVLAMLTVSYAFSFMDRQIVSILLDDLKLEFNLNDTQLGLLSGLAFALFYSFLAIPIARLADRTNRVRIISIAIAIWSLVTTFCGAAQNFLQLFLGRMGVGVGEAGGLSPSHSVIADYFDEKSRPLAISIYSMGIAIGSMIGLVLGGYVTENHGWRWAFIIAGVPGIAFAVLFALTVKEPTRGRFEYTKSRATASQSFSETIKDLISNRPYMGINIGHLLIAFASNAINAWLPTFLMRAHDVNAAEVGKVMGMITLFGAAGGVFVGGALATYFTRFDNRWQVRLPVIALCIGIPFMWYGFQQNALTSAAWIIGIGFFFFYMQHGPTLAVVQSCVKPEQRAQAASLVFFSSNLLGLGLGPLFVGWISDLGIAELGEAGALLQALQWILLISIPSIFIFWWTANFLGEKSE